jgi:antitoxin VapB
MERRMAKATVAELLTIADRAAAHLGRPYADHVLLLYDENGQPRR